MNVSGNDISIDIGASSSKAVEEINKITSSLKKLKDTASSKATIKLEIDGSAATKIEKLGKSLQDLEKTLSWLGWGSEQLKSIAEAMTVVANAKISGKNMENLANGIIQLANATASIAPGALESLESTCNSLQKLQGVDLRGLSSALRAVGKEASSNKRSVWQVLKDDIHAVINAGNKVKSVFQSLGHIIAYPFKEAGAGIKNFASGLSNIASSIKGKISDKLKPLTSLMNRIGRTVLLRAIRGAIKAIVNALKEGLEYAYKFSSALGGEGNRFAAAMDKLSASTNKMKVQLGSAFISLLTAIEPIISALINLVTKLADTLAQLFSAFTGSRYLKANNVAGKFADTMKSGAGSAKEWRNQLLGFDELNRLNDPNSGGGGSGSSGIDASTAYSDSAISARIKTFVGTIKQLTTGRMFSTLGTYVARTINSFIPSPEESEKFGQKLGVWIDGAFKAAVAFLKELDFSGMGTAIASFLNGAINSIDFYTIGEFLVLKFTAVLDFLGGALGTLDWDSLGIKIGDFLRGAFDTASDWLTSKDWNNIGQNVYTKFKSTMEKIDFNSLADSFFHFLGVAFAAVMEFIDGFFHDTIDSIKNYFKEKTEEMGGDVWKGFCKGISDAFKSVKEWCNEHIVKPFVQGIKDLLGIHSPSTVFEDIGTSIINGLFGGLSSAWSSVSTWISETFGGLISWCQSAHSWLQDVLTGIGLVNSTPTRVQPMSRTTGMQEFASGGYPAAGQLFIAREAGPELVGTMSGRTAVANNQEITAGIYEAVYDAMSSVMSQYGGSGDVHVYLDSREIRSGQNRLSRAMG